MARSISGLVEFSRPSEDEDYDNAARRHGRLRALFFIHTSLAREFIHPRARVHHSVSAHAHTRVGKGLGRTYVRSEKAKPNLLFYTVCVSTPICAALDQAEKRPFSFFFLLFSPLFFLSFFFFSSSLFAARKEVAPNKFPAESFSALCSARTMAPR